SVLFAGRPPRRDPLSQYHGVGAQVVEGDSLDRPRTAMVCPTRGTKLRHLLNWKVVRCRAPCNRRLQTPPGPEGSNGSGLPCVPRITRCLTFNSPSPSTMYQVIARKYRPQSFDDVVNQDHIKTTLRNAIGQNRIAH